MKLKKIAAVSALVVATAAVGAGTATAQPAPAPSPQEVVNNFLDQPLGGSTDITVREASAYISALTEGVRRSNMIGTIVGTVAGAVGGCLVNGSTGGAIAGAATGGLAALPVAAGLCVSGATAIAPLAGTVGGFAGSAQTFGNNASAFYDEHGAELLPPPFAPVG